MWSLYDGVDRPNPVEILAIPLINRATLVVDRIFPLGQVGILGPATLRTAPGPVDDADVDAVAAAGFTAFRAVHLSPPIAITLPERSTRVAPPQAVRWRRPLPHVLEELREGAPLGSAAPACAGTRSRTSRPRT